jgi:hypothetical protein
VDQKIIIEPISTPKISRGKKVETGQNFSWLEKLINQ